MYQQLSADWLNKSNTVNKALNNIVSGVNWSSFGYSYNSADIHTLETAIKKINTYPRKDAGYPLAKRVYEPHRPSEEYNP